jgi:hypothetical protein
MEIEMRVKEMMMADATANIFPDVDIATYYDPPPIPQRNFDWAAVDTSTYGGDPEDPVGFGKTKEEAIQDLLEQIAERQMTRMSW